MSKKPTASSNLTASGFTSAVAAGAQAAVNTGSPPGAIGGKGSYSYISGLAGKNLAFRQLVSGLSPAQLQKIEDIIATTAALLRAAVGSGNTNQYVSLLAQGIDAILGVIGVQDIESNEVLRNAFNAIFAGQTGTGSITIPAYGALNATIDIISGRVPGASGTTRGFTGPTFTGSYSGTSAPVARPVNPGVSTGSFTSLVPLDPVTKLPRSAAQFFPTDIAVDFIAGNAIYVSDEKQGMIRRVIPGDSVSPALPYPVVQTIYSNFNSQPRSIKYDTVNKLVYTSFTTTNEFYIYSTGLSTGYAVKGVQSGKYLDVLGIDVVGNMYYLQYNSGGSLDLGALNYIYKYNPIKNMHTLLTNGTAAGANIVNPGSGTLNVGTNWKINAKSISPAQLVFAEKTRAYAVLLPDTLVTFSLTGGEILSDSDVTVVQKSLTGASNVSYLAASKGATDGNTYLYYHYSEQNTIYRLSSGNSHSMGSRISLFSGTAGYTGNGGTASAVRTQFTNGWETAQPAFTFDSAGNMYFADIGNTVIRKVTRGASQQAVDSTSIVTYVGGTPNPSPSTTGGLPSSARFNGDILPFKPTV